MKFFNIAKNNYENGFIKYKDFLLKEPITAIKSIKPLEMIDTTNPFYYLGLSLYLVLELLIELFKKITLFLTGDKSDIQFDIGNYLFYLLFNVVITLSASLLISSPFLITFLLVPQLFFEAVLGLYLYGNFLFVKATLNAWSAAKQEERDIARQEVSSMKFAEIAKLAKEQSLVELNEINETRAALNQLYLDEKACLAELKSSKPELFNKVEDLIVNNLLSDNEDENSLSYQKLLLNQMLDSYPRLPKNVKYTYELVNNFCEERAEHHSQVMLLAKVVLDRGYEEIGEHSDRCNKSLNSDANTFQL